MEIAFSPRVRVNGEYIVLGVLAEFGGRVKLHLLTDDARSFGWLGSDCFRTISTTIPIRRIEAIDPDKGKTTTTYDDAGQVTTTTDARGTTLAYTYDALGRKTTGYDHHGRPLGTSVTLPASAGALAGTYTSTVVYNVNGSVSYQTLPKVGNLAAETVTSYYDAVGQPTQLSGSFPNGIYALSGRWTPYGEPLRMAQIARTRAHRVQPGGQGKYFFPTRGQAENLGQMYAKAGWGEQQILTRGQVPRVVVEGAETINAAGEGLAWFIRTPHIPSICHVTCLGPVG